MRPVDKERLGWLYGEERRVVRVVINAAAVLRAKKPGKLDGASQKQTFLESVYPVSGVSRYYFDTYQL